ncbi:Protein CBG27429 [Caenorhabditis briggsae]|uniref:Protein CBG27429 n=1 Tax=Caenorhabditis briggsae TaxID=6238 RepID=B6IK06_CAEBR|nr:Protein CBG27429 [Caenorhabditis briggsae]CAS00236.1 Protein CBG27429 [Caenorhabditis briggsae]
MKNTTLHFSCPNSNRKKFSKDAPRENRKNSSQNIRLHRKSVFS